METTDLRVSEPIATSRAQAAASRSPSVFLDQAQQAQASALAHLGMALVGKLVLNDDRDARADRRRPVQQPARRPFEVRSVGAGMWSLTVL